MVLLMLLLAGTVITLVMWEFGWSIVWGLFALCVALLVWCSGGFRQCPKCKSRLTTRVHEETPDMSYGLEIMHPRTVQQCWNLRCGETTVIRGFAVTGSKYDDK